MNEFLDDKTYIRQLLRENELLKQQIHSTQSTIPSESNPTSHLSSSIQLSSEMQEQLNSLNQTIQQQELMIRELMSEKSAIQSRFDRVSEERDELQRENENTEKELNRMREMYERGEGMTDQGKKEREEYDYEIIQLKETVRLMREEEKRLQCQLQRIEDEGNNGVTAISQKQTDGVLSEELQKQLQVERRENVLLREELSVLRKRVEGRQEEREGLEDIRGKLETMLQTIRNHLQTSSIFILFYFILFYFILFD